MLFQARMARHQQEMLMVSSMYHTRTGHLEQMFMGSTHTYSAPGVGYGFANMNLLQGAAESKRVQDIAFDPANDSRTLTIGQLEQRWRAVE
ncbi:hypothetical protein AAE478_007298 [Parahypoxylon ruwenzoriense]